MKDVVETVAVEKKMIVENTKQCNSDPYHYRSNTMRYDCFYDRCCIWFSQEEKLHIKEQCVPLSYIADKLEP